MVEGRVRTTPLCDVVGRQKTIDPELFVLARILDR
jgi:hypothetical protein